MKRTGPILWVVALCAALFLPPRALRAEAMLQYFNTSWADITARMPELAEAGYNSLWVPPPTKGSGGLSVGYDLWDRFDLGGKDQRGTTRTRYGTEEELHEMIRTAHRFGIRVYFDNIMNHNAFDVPGFNEYTPIDLYPGFIAAEDFHLRKTEDGFYRKWDNTRSWGDAWQVLNLGLADLIDISQEGPPNANFGRTEGSTFPKFSGVRHPNNPEYYAYHPTLGYVGFNSPHITTGVIAANPGFYTEDVNAMLIRSARWLMDRTKVDGLRLDAVKHVPDFFFGQQSGDKNGSNAGYLGGVQQQFNLSRGFSDWDNHRDSVFDTEIPRDDAMVFGEHLGQPPGYQGYIDAGMRLVDNDLRSALNNKLGNPWDGIGGLDQPGAFGFAPGVAVMHAQSHDSDYAARRELQHATYFTRAGLPLVYTDGNNHAETLGESGGAFPRHSNTAFLGQFGDNRLPNLLYIHNQFARGSQHSAFSDPDYIAYERRDYREGHGAASQQAVLLFMMNDNYSSGASRSVSTSFPRQGGTSNDAYLYNYSSYGGGFYTYASNLGSVVVPPGGYFAFSWKNPDPAEAWSRAGGEAITLRENGVNVTNVLMHVRRDGRDGDPNFNPYGLSDTNATDYAYAMPVPRVTSATNLSVYVRADGSAENILLKLDGGMNLNAINHALGDGRDNPPALSTDTFMGYEQMSFVQRQHREKFAAEVAAGAGNRNVIQSPGAETWEVVIGTNSVTTLNGTVNTPSNAFTAQYVYHNPRTAEAPGGALQFNPAPQNAANTPVDIWVKVGVLVPADVNAAYVYYTTDHTFPEGAGGFGAGSTRTQQMFFVQNLAGGDWWKATLPAQPAGTRIRYKIGLFNRAINIASVYPSSPGNVDLKRSMTTAFRLQNLNLETIQYRPHNDYGAFATGLEEGFHLLSARVFLNRGPGSPFPGASIYNTFTRTFYYDAETPGGEIKFPNQNDTVGGSEYEVVVRTDRTTRQVFFHIDDANPNNDDGITGRAYGNGLASNAVDQAWAPATQVTASSAISSAYPLEWRFKYRNIAPGNQPATIKVRLLELSSSANHNLPAAQAHVTELVRTVTANGPSQRFFFDWPTVDGTLVGEDYRVRVKFETTLGDGFNDAQLRDSFTFEIKPDGASDGEAQPKSEFLITRSIGNGLGEWAFDLPDLYNSDLPNRLYELVVSQVNQSAVLSRTSVKVRALPTPPKPFVDIIEPEEVDVIGNRKSIEVTGLPSTNHFIRVATDLNATSVRVTVNDSVANVVFAGVSTGGVNRLFWDYDWTIASLGSHRISAEMDTDSVTNTVEAVDTIEVPVVLVRRVPANPADLDDDDDGLLDTAETSNPGAPASANSDTWTQDEVHDEWALGRTQPLGPDSDLDGLSDGLELGYRAPQDPGQTSLSADLDGDGFPNFLADLDPPFYNTVDNYNRVPEVTSASAGGDRRRLVRGSVTNPNNPDTDNDGIPDGVEDRNRNGWTDGDGASLPVTFLPWLGRSWPNGRIDAGETWTETDPNKPDSDADGVTDGFEDANKDGFIAGDSNSNRVYEVTEAWSETNPLDDDTDGDALPDGWEARYSFDPLDNGVDSLRTSTPADGQVVNGPDGNPDGDTIVVGGVTNQYTNLMEYQNGTDPRRFNAPGAVLGESITIGAGPVIGVINGRTYREEFQDWKLADLLVLDETEGDGSNNQGGDIYPAGDGFDSSRDITAFYVRDGGDVGAGGDGRVYFRVDFADLQAFAEEQAMDLYVVIDTGQSATGERALPDDVDTLTDMRWETVVAVYDSRNGRVYTDTNPLSNSSTTNQELTQFGVQVRDQNHADGFKGAYFNSELDAVEFAISRDALTLPEFAAAGWNGLNVADLRFQVFTTKQGTANTPRGAGDIGGRSDIRDSIYDDQIAEDHWRAQENFVSRITTGFGFNGFHDRGKRAKVALLVHGNQAIKPGNVMQSLLNTGSGAGYHRVPLAHEVFRQPLNLHLTATLASALQWAKTDPATTNSWRLGRTANGPVFNAWLADLAASNLVSFVGTTFSDHMLPYFPADFQSGNIALARSVLEGIYGVAPSARVLWIPERLSDSATLAGVKALGFSHGLIDQNRHVLEWFGRTASLTEDAYRINRVEGLDCFVLNDFASTFLFDDDDKGLSTSLRSLALKRARSGARDQVIALFKAWEEFGANASADAYDLSLRWMANRPWIQVTTLDAIAAGQVDLSSPPDGLGDTWGVINRGSGLNKPKVAQDWLDHAAKEDFNRWYFGATGPNEEGLANKRFNILPGTPLPAGRNYGLVSTGGVARTAWLDVTAVTNPGLRPLAEAVMHASVFQTAFHNQSNNNLEKFSTGDYVYPDNTNETLADFARHAQSQTRFASVYRRVDQWAANPPAVPTATAEDVDQDGQDEYLLCNNRVFLLFERAGGRLTGSWLRNLDNGRVAQVSGNLAGYSGVDTEEEGFPNTSATGDRVGAYRTSLLKDWWALTGTSGSAGYINALYFASPAASGTGWTFTSPDTRIAKTVTLGTGDAASVAYQLSGGLTRVYVRNGLSPNLWDLIRRGQENLGAVVFTNNTVRLRNTLAALPVEASLALGAGATYNPAAVDDEPGSGVNFHTLPMRNQAQTQQVEVYGSGAFSFNLEFRSTGADSDGDLMPDWFENQFVFLNRDAANDANLDTDADGASNLHEYIAGTDPSASGSRPQVQQVNVQGAGFEVRFPTQTGRVYHVWYKNHSLTDPSPWVRATTAPIPGTGGVVSWLDDGSLTTPPPAAVLLRYYRTEVELAP